MNEDEYWFFLEEEYLASQGKVSDQTKTTNESEASNENKF